MTNSQSQTSQKEDSHGKLKNKYVFPNFLAKAMSKVSFRAQMEASLLSLSLLCVAMTMMAIYMIFWGQGDLAYKIILVVNLLCGFVFLSSYLVTTYQQYKSYMDTMGFDASAERKNIKAKGNLFKRIKLALQERKRAKKAEKGISKIDELLKKSGVEKEIKEQQEDSYTGYKPKEYSGASGNLPENAEDLDMN